MTANNLPIAQRTFEEKVRTARQLESMGVDVIEAGFPVASDGDFQAIRRRIAEECRNTIIAGFCRTLEAAA